MQRIISSIPFSENKDQRLLYNGLVSTGPLRCFCLASAAVTTPLFLVPRLTACRSVLRSTTAVMLIRWPVTTGDECDVWWATTDHSASFHHTETAC